MIRMPFWALGCLLVLAASLSACGGSGKAASPVFHAEGNPANLSEWNILNLEKGNLLLAEGVISYDLNTPLFSDYAHKLRTVWMPEGTSAKYQDKDTFDFPVGTIISKTFYYPVPNGAAPSGSKVLRAPGMTAEILNAGFNLSEIKLIETRLLVHRSDGWAAIPYVWNDEQTDARLKRTGDIKSLSLISANKEAQEFAYVVPNANQCAGCHATNATTRKTIPIGPKARHLNKEYSYMGGGKNQLLAWQENEILTGLPALQDVPRNALWNDLGSDLNHKARSYLDINCSHCHNEVGPADTSGLFLEPDTPFGTSMGKCKMPIAAGTGTGGYTFGIVPGNPGESIFTYRIASTNPAEMMPELGRSLAHAEGVDLIRDWIEGLDGHCE